MKHRTSGVLLAAGRGRRMGMRKQLLPWPIAPNENIAMVAAAYDGLARHCGRMVVVAPDDDDAVIDALGQRDAVVVRASSEAPMFTSLCAGLEEAVRLVGDDGLVAVHPGDHPVVDDESVAALVSACVVDGRSRSHMPVVNDKGGHPVVIPAPLVDSILQFDGDGGLRRYWELHPAACRRVPMSSNELIMDIDTPEMYERAVAAARAQWSRPQ